MVNRKLEAFTAYQHCCSTCCIAQVNVLGSELWWKECVLPWWGVVIRVKRGRGLGQSQKFVWVKVLRFMWISRIKSLSLFQSHGLRPISSAVDAGNQTHDGQNELLNFSKHTPECATAAEGLLGPEGKERERIRLSGKVKCDCRSAWLADSLTGTRRR